MPILAEQMNHRCDRCGITHQDGPLYLCLKCTAVLCQNQLAPVVSDSDELWHELTNGKACGPVIESALIAAVDKAKEEGGVDLSHITVYRVDANGDRTVIYTVATPKRGSFCTVDLGIRSDAPGLCGGHHTVVPQLVITEGQKLEVDFGDYPSKKEQEECREDT